jgi:hypothetical protein
VIVSIRESKLGQANRVPAKQENEGTLAETGDRVAFEAK